MRARQGVGADQNALQGCSRMQCLVVSLCRAMAGRQVAGGPLATTTHRGCWEHGLCPPLGARQHGADGQQGLLTDPPACAAQRPAGAQPQHGAGVGGGGRGRAPRQQRRANGLRRGRGADHGGGRAAGVLLWRRAQGGRGRRGPHSRPAACGSCPLRRCAHACTHPDAQAVTGWRHDLGR